MRRIFPTQTQWTNFLEARLMGYLPESISTDFRVNVQTFCLYCQLPLEISALQLIRIGCLVKMTNEEIIPGYVIEAYGMKYHIPEAKRLTSQVFPMSVRGAGCLDCSSQLLSVAGEESKWAGVKDQATVEVPVMEASLEGRRYQKIKGRWFTEQGIAVPTSMWGELERAGAKQVGTVKEERASYSAKRVPFLDVSAEVLEMPKGRSK